MLSWVWAEVEEKQGGKENMVSLDYTILQWLILDTCFWKVLPVAWHTSNWFCQKHFSTSNFVPRPKSWHGIYSKTQTNSSKFLTSGLPLAANLIPFKGRSWWLAWFLVKPCLQLNMRVLVFAGAVDTNVMATHSYPVSRKIFWCVFCILYIVIWLTITDMSSYVYVQ